jgi:aldose 1-epimerase
MNKPHSTIFALVMALAGCREAPGKNQESAVTEELFGKLSDGRGGKIFTLVNKNGLKARVTEYGAIHVSMATPDKSGKSADITHGYDSLEGWLANTSYFGATVGRFANRIKDGRFTLDGKEYALEKNNDPGGIPCHLHGGLKGFDKVLWSGKPSGPNSVEFTHVSRDGEEGYPGTFTVKVVYSLSDQNELAGRLPPPPTHPRS